MADKKTTSTNQGMIPDTSADDLRATGMQALLRSAQESQNKADAFSGPATVGSTGPESAIPAELLNDTQQIKQLADSMTKALSGGNISEASYKTPLDLEVSRKVFEFLRSEQQKTPEYKASFVEGILGPILTGAGVLTANPLLLLAGGGLVGSAGQRQQRLMAPIDYAEHEFIRDFLQGQFRQRSETETLAQERELRTLYDTFAQAVQSGRYPTDVALQNAMREAGIPEYKIPQWTAAMGALRPTETEKVLREAETAKAGAMKEAISGAESKAINNLHKSLMDMGRGDFTEEQDPVAVKLDLGDPKGAALDLRTKSNETIGNQSIQNIEQHEFKLYGLALGKDGNVLLSPRPLVDTFSDFRQSVNPAKGNLVYTRAVQETAKDIGIHPDDPDAVYRPVSISGREEKDLLTKYGFGDIMNITEGPAAKLINDFWFGLTTRADRISDGKGENVALETKDYSIRTGISPKYLEHGASPFRIKSGKLKVFRNPFQKGAIPETILHRLDSMFMELEEGSPKQRESIYKKYLTDEFYNAYRLILMALQD